MAKPGTDWTSNDLIAYKITIESQNEGTFFGRPNLLTSAINPQLLTTLSATDMTDESCFHVVNCMNLAIHPVPGKELAVNDFAIEL